MADLKSIKKITKNINGQEVGLQVESAIRDGQGNVISDTYDKVYDATVSMELTESVTFNGKTYKAIEPSITTAEVENILLKLSQGYTCRLATKDEKGAVCWPVINSFVKFSESEPKRPIGYFTVESIFYFGDFPSEADSSIITGIYGDTLAAFRPTHRYITYCGYINKQGYQSHKGVDIKEPVYLMPENSIDKNGILIPDISIDLSVYDQILIKDRPCYLIYNGHITKIACVTSIDAADRGSQIMTYTYYTDTYGVIASSRLLDADDGSIYTEETLKTFPLYSTKPPTIPTSYNDLTDKVAIVSGDEARLEVTQTNNTFTITPKGSGESSQWIEFGATNQLVPSASLVVGGIFFEEQ